MIIIPTPSSPPQSVSTGEAPALFPSSTPAEPENPGFAQCLNDASQASAQPAAGQPAAAQMAAQAPAPVPTAPGQTVPAQASNEADTAEEPSDKSVPSTQLATADALLIAMSASAQQLTTAVVAVAAVPTASAAQATASAPVETAQPQPVKGAGDPAPPGPPPPTTDIRPQITVPDVSTSDTVKTVDAALQTVGEPNSQTRQTVALPAAAPNVEAPGGAAAPSTARTATTTEATARPTADYSRPAEQTASAETDRSPAERVGTAPRPSSTTQQGPIRRDETETRQLTDRRPAPRTEGGRGEPTLAADASDTVTRQAAVKPMATLDRPSQTVETPAPQASAQKPEPQNGRPAANGTAMAPASPEAGAGAAAAQPTNLDPARPDAAKVSAPDRTVETVIHVAAQQTDQPRPGDRNAATERSTTTSPEAKVAGVSAHKGSASEEGRDAGPQERFPSSNADRQPGVTATAAARSDTTFTVQRAQADAPQAPTDRSQVIQQVAQRLETMQLTHGRQQVTMHLQPDHLGDLRLTVVTNGQDVTARIVADTATARQALSEGHDHLRTALEQRGFNLQGLDVALSQDGGARRFVPFEAQPQLVQKVSSAATSAQTAPLAAVAATRASVRMDGHLDYQA